MQIIRFVLPALLTFGGMAHAQQKPAVQHVPANPNYYRQGRGGRSIQYVVLHTVEGSARSCINTFRSGGRRVSAHYVVDFDGAITQMVADGNTAWHAGMINPRSIGIEHAGWADRNRWTPEQMRASARLTRWLCDTYGIPIDRQHIIGHIEAPGATHHDPGRFFNWDLYMRLVRGGEVGPPAPGEGARATPLRPQQNEVVGALRFERAARGTSTPAQGLPGLTVAWDSTGAVPQQAARVLVEEIGGPLRYDSQHLPGPGEQHVVTAPLQHGRRYRWRVRTFDGVGSAESEWVEFTVDLTPPQLELLTPEPDQLVTSTPVLRWRYSDPDRTTQAGFRVALDDDEDHSRLIGDTRELNGAESHYFLQAHLQPGRTYWVRVAAHDGRGNLSPSEWRRFRTASTFVDAAGTGLTVKPITPRDGALVGVGTRPVLRWAYHSSEQRDLLAFRIVIARDDEGGQELINQAYQAPGKRGYMPPAALPAGRYKWRVRAWDGKDSAWSEWASFIVGGGTGLIDRVN